MRPDPRRWRARSACSARIPVKQHRQITASVGYLSQRFSLYGDLSIDENIAFFAEIHGVSDFSARRDRLLDMTQLTRFRARLADQLSGGMKQKLALACTLVHEPQVIVLDEPTTGVDPVSRREFWKLLSQFLAQGITILMSTPYLDEAERCSRIALLHEGQVLALDEPTRLRSSLKGTLFEVMVASSREALDRLSGQKDITSAQVFGDRLHVWIDHGDREFATRSVTAALSAAALTPQSVRAIVPSLEDVFIARITAKSPGSAPAAEAMAQKAQTYETTTDVFFVRPVAGSAGISRHKGRSGSRSRTRSLAGSRPATASPKRAPGRMAQKRRRRAPR